MAAAVEGASVYLNNLLLARGLNDGKSLNFAQPSDSEIPKIINLVHNLILRRDRDAERQETMAATIRQMRSDEADRLLEFQRLQTKNVQLMGDAAAAEAQERNLRANIKRLEMQIRDLKEQTLKMKSLVDQVRAKCLSDVRKRDLEIEKLKGHISGMQRGKKEIGGMRIHTINPRTLLEGSRERRDGRDVNNADWTLENETNDFLAALVNETSTENVTLRQIVGDTMDTLSGLTGLESQPVAEIDNGIGIPGQFRASRRVQPDKTLIPCQMLAQQMLTVLEHCRTILKDPSFVPIEEVQIREEEIAKLREGWEKMADRWKQAVTMMAQWKQRMLQEGRSADVGELSDLSFGRSVALRPDGRPVLGQDEDLSSIFDQSVISTPEMPSNSGIARDVPSDAEESELELEPERPSKRLASSPAKRGVKIAKTKTILGEVDGNKVSHSHIKQTGTMRSSNGSDLGRNSDPENDNFRVQVASKESGENQTARKQNQLSLSQKLAAVEAEAVEAKQNLETKVTHKRKAPSKVQGLKRTSRRRSTLSPEELAALMGRC